MSYEAWLIGRKVDASRRNFCGSRDIVFDFEVFIGELRQNLTLDVSENRYRFSRREADEVHEASIALNGMTTLLLHMLQSVPPGYSRKNLGI